MYRPLLALWLTAPRLMTLLFWVFVLWVLH